MQNQCPLLHRAALLSRAMKCFNHHDEEAVGVCVRCGKALCRACANEGEDGRLVCSRECSSGLRDLRQFAAGCFLLGIGALAVVISVNLWTAHPIGTVVMVLYGLGCLLIGAALISEPRWDHLDRHDSFVPYGWISGEIRWRAGIALREAHRFRKRLEEVLAWDAKLNSGGPGVSEFELSGIETRRQMLERICAASGEIPGWFAPSLEAAVAELGEDVELAQALGWTYFVDHDRRTNSIEERQAMLLELITAARRLDSGELRLRMIKKKLAGKSEERPPSPRPSPPGRG